MPAWFENIINEEDCHFKDELTYLPSMTSFYCELFVCVHVCSMCLRNYFEHVLHVTLNGDCRFFQIPGSTF
jgi:hypothetical protein